MMETTTGLVTELNDEVLERIQRIQKNAEYLKQINFDQMTPRRQGQLLRTGRAKIGRNDPCPCGSTHSSADGQIKRNKFKNCCLNQKQKKPLELSDLPAVTPPRGNVRARTLYS